MALLDRLTAPLGRMSRTSGRFPGRAPGRLSGRFPGRPPSLGAVLAAADICVLDSYLFRAGLSGFGRGEGLL